MGGLCHHRPDLLVKAVDSSVEAVSAVIDGQLILHSVKGETTVLDAVRAPTDDGIEVCLLRLPLLYSLEAEDDIGDVPILIRDKEGNDLGTVVGDLGSHPLGTREGV